MNNQRVVHVHGKVRYDVYVGRGRDPRIDPKRTDLKPAYDWGNKFLIGRHTRESAILAHVAYVLERPWLVDKVREELRRKILGCWCDPLACHANILAEGCRPTRGCATSADDVADRAQRQVGRDGSAARE